MMIDTLSDGLYSWHMFADHLMIIDLMMVCNDLSLMMD